MILKRVKAEIANLEADLASDPRFRRWRELHRFEQIYSEFANNEHDTSGDTADVEAQQSAPQDQTDKPDSKGMHRKTKTSPTELIIQAACRAIEDRNEPVPIKALYAELEARGIVVGGSDPLRNFSSKLSVSDRVYNEKPLGWWLTSRKAEYASPESEGPTNGMAGPSMNSGAEHRH